MDDPLPQPTILVGGRMDALPEGPGFGHLVDVDWIRSQPFDDPSGVLDGLG
jgi:hypothetical protein